MSGLFSTKPIVNKEERLSAVRLQTSAYGAPVPLYFGENRATGNIIWYGGFQAIEHRQKQSSGGKGGGGGSTVSISYTYKTGLMLALGEGIIAVDSVMPGNEGFKVPSSLGFELFAGALGQPTWSVLTSRYPAQALGYSGTALLAVSAYDLGSSANLPNFSVKLRGFPDLNTRLGGYIELFLSSKLVGAGFPSVRLNGLGAIDTYLAAQDVTFSPKVVEIKAAAEYLREWTSMSNIGMVWSEGDLKFKPLTDSAGVVAHLDADDFLVSGDELPVTFEPGNEDDAYNRLSVQYEDASNDYNTSTYEEVDQAQVDRYGLRPANTEVYTAVKSAPVAWWVAQHRLHRLLYIRGQFKFRLSERWVALEPMDVVTLTDPLLGLWQEPVMIIEINEGDDGDYDVIAEPYTGTLDAASEAPPVQVPVGGGPDAGVAPGDANAPLIFQPPVALVPSGPEIWMATSGGPNWGGCEVWASLDGDSYRRVGLITGSARHGSLRADLPAQASPDEVNTLEVEIHTGELEPATQQDVEDRITTCYAGGELLAYRDSTLVGAGEYDLEYLNRGIYGTEISSHLAGAPFARLDDNIFKYAVPSDWIGREIYIKLVSFNVYGLSSQSLADVTAYSYTIQEAPPPALASLTATVFQTTVILEWGRPEDPEKYSRIDFLRSDDDDFNNATVIASVSPLLARYSDAVGESSKTLYYWARLISIYGEVGILTGPVMATTGSVGGVPVFALVPTVYMGDIIYVRADMSLYEWDGISAYEPATPLIAANRILAGTVSVALRLEAAEIVGGSIQIGNLFSVNTVGKMLTKSALTGQRTERTSEGTYVYDAAGDLTVELGELL
ncbi:hypothetical protein IHQ56_02780 [Methylobacillus flagellatus]|uniref:phage tail protein n=1 Tax=Methylobacillus flagellatus TaxID=405 RepID=UPI002853BCEC|nr:phage tail protein [Methylobacillus flagellatus]MDR5170735.1 hypothetical protein [Methylobacillus flagellatus]